MSDLANFLASFNNDEPIITDSRISGGGRLIDADTAQTEEGVRVRFPNVNAREVDTFDPAKGFSPPSDPFNPVTAVSLYLDWLDQLICLAVPPSHMTYETAQEAIKDFPDTMLFRTEKELFDVFFNNVAQWLITCFIALHDVSRAFV